jgi:peptide chain release factor 2
MEELKKAQQQLTQQITEAAKRLKLDQQQLQLKTLEQQQAEPDFWSDQPRAQATTQKIAKIKRLIEPWLELKRGVNELIELLALDDTELIDDLQKQYKELLSTYEGLAFQLRFSGRYDSYDAIVTIQAGAGGTDAQDWAQLLERMYIRWAEQHDIAVTVIDETAAEEAGIKSATLSLVGDYVFGKLRGEHGVHRLVRLSPFNSAGSRETSFAMVEMVPDIDEPDEVKIDEQDLKIDVYRSGGRGGQSVNTTDSAVRVTHLPTGIVVAIQNERSQIQNRETALKIVRSKLAQLAAEQHQEKISELRGPNQEAAWGNQIRNYVMHPYTLVKDTRTNYQENDVQAVLDGKIDGFIEQYLNSPTSTD